jgi:putative transposase
MDEQYLPTFPIRHPKIPAQAELGRGTLGSKLSAQRLLWYTSPDSVGQKRFYDSSVWIDRKRIEKLRYLHRNPVKRGLAEQPEQWKWSSFRWYFYGEPGK